MGIRSLQSDLDTSVEAGKLLRAELDSLKIKLTQAIQEAERLKNSKEQAGQESQKEIDRLLEQVTGLQNAEQQLQLKFKAAEDLAKEKESASQQGELTLAE